MLREKQCRREIDFGKLVGYVLVVANFGDSKSRQRAGDALSRLEQIERRGSKDQYDDDAPDYDL